jgi:hypothetical protein
MSRTGPPLRLGAHPGWVIFSPGRRKYSYRYGPTFIVNEDGSLDAWFSSPGGKGAGPDWEWDWVRHRRSPDRGLTWGPEQVVLRPTPGSRDRFSICDPGVVRFGGWYHLGYTSVDNKPGNRNCVFVARARKPTGPFEKWNGRGWGGNPEPIITFDGPAEAWGAGEPSFVVKDGVLHIYYSWKVTVNPDGPTCNETRVATAPAGDRNWPASLQQRGLAFDRVGGEDAADVKYLEGPGLFLAVATASRFTARAHIVYRTSADGIRFGAPRRLRRNIRPWCHNAGLTGGPEGRIPAGPAPLLGYAYSGKPGLSWGHWHTFLQPLELA